MLFWTQKVFQEDGRQLSLTQRESHKSDFTIEVEIPKMKDYIFLN